MNAPATPRDATGSFTITAIRDQFPALDQTVHGHPLVYLDNAATTQKPRCVIDAITDYYEKDNANVHRGVHELSQRATQAYEGAREKVRSFINAPSVEEIIFTRGTTEAINLVAASYGGDVLKAGDEIIVSMLEHHSNIVPWQLLCERVGATLRVIPIDNDGTLQLDAYEALLNDRTRLVGIVQVSNALGIVNPVKEMVETAHSRGVPVLVDGAQAAPHMPIDVQALGCDFYAFSGHKLYGPTGIGVLYGRREILDKMPPYQSGGDMIQAVSFSGTTFNDLPYKFEAGTPNMAGAIGLGAAIDFVGAHMDEICSVEQELMQYANSTLSAIDGLQIVGAAALRAGAMSFLLDDIHPHDIGSVVDMYGIAIRVGHHCAQPLMERLGLVSTARASFAVYNTTEDIDRLAAAIPEVFRIFR
jgi:cysteine desulfurase/selenocysteine lyase